MIDLAQLYKIGLVYNINIFDGITLPDGSPLDLELVKNTIMDRCGLNIPMYAEPSVMASAITVWSAKNQYTFKHLAKIYEAEYSPIENYDRFEDYKDSRTKNVDDYTEGNNSKTEETDSEASRDTTHSGTDTTTTENETSAYNSPTYQDDNQSTSSINHGEKIIDKTVGAMDKQTIGNLKTDREISEDETIEHSAHLHGNIGTVSAMSMEKEEYELLKQFNPYNFIAEMFENELTLFVY